MHLCSTIEHKFVRQTNSEYVSHLTVEQVEWLKLHASNFNKGQKIFEVLQVNDRDLIMCKENNNTIQMQKASRDFLAGVAANIGGGSRRMPELCCISLEVTALNPTRSFRQTRCWHTL